MNKAGIMLSALVQGIKEHKQKKLRPKMSKYGLQDMELYECKVFPVKDKLEGRKVSGRLRHNIVEKEANGTLIGKRFTVRIVDTVVICLRIK